MEHRQGLQSIRVRCAQAIGAGKDPQSVEKTECHSKPHQDPHQPPDCGKQGEASIDRLENHVERCEKDDHARAVNQISGDADTKELFVRQDVPSSYRRIVLNNQRSVDAKIDEYHHDERDQVSESRHSCGGSLRFVDQTDCHFSASQALNWNFHFVSSAWLHEYVFILIRLARQFRRLASRSRRCVNPYPGGASRAPRVSSAPSAWPCAAENRSDRSHDCQSLRTGSGREPASRETART